MILFQSNVDTELLAMRSAVEDLPEGCPGVRWLSAERIATTPPLDDVDVVVRLLGGIRSWEQGLAELLARSTVPAGVARSTTMPGSGRVAVVPLRASLPDAMTVERYVLLGRSPHLAPLAAERDEDLAVAADAITTLELDALATRRLDALSGGERQRAVLLVPSPRERGCCSSTSRRRHSTSGTNRTCWSSWTGCAVIVASPCSPRCTTSPPGHARRRPAARPSRAFTTATPTGGRPRCPNLTPTTSRPTTRAPTSCAGRRRSCS